MQEAITKVGKRSRCHKLTLYISKCEVSLFSNKSKEARWQPSIQQQLLSTIDCPRSYHRQDPLDYTSPVVGI